jgi:uncharacterized membrane protein YkvA (DUF1232 family)
LARWKEKAKQLKNEVYVLYQALKDPRTPWYAKALITLIAAYVLSPVDLIPDFIPVLGYLDDIVLVTVVVLMVRKMIPKEVLEEYRQRVKPDVVKDKSKWIAATIIIGIWLLVLYLIVKSVWLWL